MTDEEIVAMDFYDFCGVESVFMTPADKIKWWREFVEAAKEYDEIYKRYHRYEIQTINSQTEGLNYRITDRYSDDRIGTCYLKEHAELICNALNYYENRNQLTTGENQ